MPFRVSCAPAQRQGLLKGLGKRIEKRLGKQWQKLDKALHDPAHDRHRLRLLIKRVRYGIEATPNWIALPESGDAALEVARKALGRLARLLAMVGAGPSRRRTLQPCVAAWQAAMAKAEGKRRPRAGQTARVQMPETLDRDIPVDASCHG